jgi:hypothetical protein
MAKHRVSTGEYRLFTSKTAGSSPVGASRILFILPADEREISSILPTVSVKARGTRFSFWFYKSIFTSKSIFARAGSAYYLLISCDESASELHYD